ncbi:DUF421 domain-containing protein [Psychrobacter maritimus]|jgi:uncharacterized membrane protein YcaP (DUF421 family)|uniref:DUF421 domain-containing protein n=1 Tax=Psychrobacter TaxID=497 RepID=UPI00248D1694|nr:DUF421 domain-containing protein [Psychrobacter sp. WB2]WGV13033.1 DUF421 domain-containing protein [Psychrobacter sp. WB2]
MDWISIFIYDTTWAFAAEIVIRTTIMFCLIILLLRSTGKRGIRQLSIFELTIILALGSIAGDPMFTEDLPLIQAVLIMSLVLFLYRLFTWFSTKHKLFELLLEGKPTYIVENGMLIMEDVKKGKMSHDEFFAEMRQQGVRHLGQVEVGLLETDGEFSVLLFPHEDTQYGLPIFPKEFQATKAIKDGQLYACMHCGYVECISAPNEECNRCHLSRGWAKALNNKIVN